MIHLIREATNDTSLFLQNYVNVIKFVSTDYKFKFFNYCQNKYTIFIDNEYFYLLKTFKSTYKMQINHNILKRKVLNKTILFIFIFGHTLLLFFLI